MTKNGIVKRLSVIVCLPLVFILASGAWAQNNNDDGQSRTPNVVPVPIKPKIDPGNPTPWVEPPSNNNEKDPALDSIDGATAEAAGNLTEFANTHTQRSDQLLKMRADIFDKAEALDQKFNPEQVNNMIRRKNPSLRVAGLGLMKLTILNGKRYALFFDEKTGEATLICMKGELDLESKQFGELVSGMHVAGDKGRGRDLVIMEVDDQDPSDFDVTRIDKPSFRSERRRWFADRVNHYFKVPDVNDLVVGIASGIGQGAISIGIDYLLASIHGGVYHPNLFALGLGFGVGTTVGVFNRSYTNFAYDARFSPNQQALRQLPINVFYTGALMLHTGGAQAGDHAFSIAFLAVNLIQFYYGKTFVSAPWNKSLGVRTNILQENYQRMRIGNLALRKDSVERSGLYFAPFTFKSLDTYLRSKQQRMTGVNIGGQHFQIILPIVQTVGALLANLAHIAYLKQLMKRPIGDDWSQEQYDEIRALYEKELLPWRKLKYLFLNPAEIPGVIADYEIDKTQQLNDYAVRKKIEIQNKIEFSAEKCSSYLRQMSSNLKPAFRN